MLLSGTLARLWPTGGPARGRNRRRPRNGMPGSARAKRLAGIQHSGMYLDLLWDGREGGVGGVRAGKAGAETDYFAVLQVTAVNFTLRSPEEQYAILSAYGAFVNSLTYPIQLLNRILPFDVSDYCGEIEQSLAQERNALLQDLGNDLLTFVQALASERNLLEHLFYVVIPFIPSGEMEQCARPPSLLARALCALDPRRQAQREQVARRRQIQLQLTQRVDEVRRGLAHARIQSRRLGASEILGLFYSYQCPVTSLLQPLHGDLGGLLSPVVRAAPDSRATQATAGRARSIPA